MAPLTLEDVRGAVAALTERREQLREEGVEVPEHYDVVMSDRLPQDAAEAADLLGGLAEAGVTWWVEARWDASRDTPETLLAAAQEGPPRA